MVDYARLHFLNFLKESVPVRQTSKKYLLAHNVLGNAVGRNAAEPSSPKLRSP